MGRVGEEIVLADHPQDCLQGISMVYVDITDELIKSAIESVDFCYYELKKPVVENREILIDALYCASRDLQDALLHPKKSVNADEKKEAQTE